MRSSSTVCSCKSATDLVFVVDSTASNFDAILEFVVSVVNWFDVGLDSLTRVAVVTIDDLSSETIFLNNYYNRLTLYTAIRNMTAHPAAVRSACLKT